MYAPLYAALRPARILFLCNSEASVRNDARLLRVLGASAIIYCREQAQALDLLEAEARRQSRGELSAAERIDVIVCDEETQGMPTAAFAHALALRPALRVKSLLVLTSNGEKAEALRAGGIQALARPYAEQALRENLQKAMSPLRRVLNAPDIARVPGAKAALGGKESKKPLPAVKATKSKSGPMTASDRYEQGMALLGTRDYGGAVRFFRSVLAGNEDHVGAALALAKAYRGLDDAEGVRRGLLRAAAACLRGGDAGRAADIAAVLPVGMRDKIYLYEALARMEEGEYREAALGFMDAARETPGQTLHKVIARACLLGQSPDQDISRLCDAFAGLGHDATAKVLRHRLLAYEPYIEPDESSWLDRFPLLRDVVSVASHTALAWRRQ